MPEANPEAGAITDEASATAHVASLLEEPEKPTEEEEQEPEANREEPEAVQETEEETSEGETEEVEPEAEGEELPDTIEGLAEALEFEAGDLSDYISVPVKINGKVERVTLSEAIKGYQLESDYRQKTTEVSEQRRELEAKTAEVSQRWQQRFQQLDGVIEAVASTLGSGPDEAELERLMEEDPAEYFRVKTRHEKNMAKLNGALQERERLQQEEDAAQKHLHTTRRAEQQQKLVEAIPELTNPVKLSEFERDVSKYLSESGFETDLIREFFGGAFDHRQVLIIRDAMKYRALEAGKKTLPKKLKALGRVNKPGASPTRAKTNEDKLVASRDRLKRLGAKGKGARKQQEAAAVELVKGLL